MGTKLHHHSRSQNVNNPKSEWKVAPPCRLAQTTWYPEKARPEHVRNIGSINPNHYDTQRYSYVWRSCYLVYIA
jgi:hypothetical protein